LVFGHSAFHFGPHEGDRVREVVQDERSRNSEHVKAEPPEVPVAPRISGMPACMGAAIDFDNQAQRRSEEVGDVTASEHDLPAEWNTELPAAKLEPEQELWPLRREPHVASAGREELLASGVDGARRFEHGVGARGMGLGRSPSSAGCVTASCRCAP
jgi:hypothetical protein